MILRTEEEIEAKVKELWHDKWMEPNIEVTIQPDNVNIKLSASYEPPGLKFSQLKALSEFFGTENINDDDKFSYSGCETCDYGSSYGFTLTIRPHEELPGGYSYPK